MGQTCSHLPCRTCCWIPPCENKTRYWTLATPSSLDIFLIIFTILVSLNLNCVKNYIKKYKVTSEDGACAGMQTVPPSTEVRPPSPQQRHQTLPTRWVPRRTPGLMSDRSGTACSTIPLITLYKEWKPHTFSSTMGLI